MTLALLGSACHPGNSPAEPRIRQGQGEILPGQSVTLPLAVQPGEYLRVSAEHGEGKVALDLLGPDGKAVASGGPVSRRRVETLAAIPAASGVYRLRLSAPAESLAPVRYELFLDARHPAGRADRLRVEAQRKLAEGLRDRDERSDPKNALSRLRAALPLWRSAGDIQSEIDTQNEIAATEVRLIDAKRVAEEARRALAAARQARYVRGQAKALDTLGQASPPAEAREAYRRSIQLWRTVRDDVELGSSLYNLGLLDLNDLYDLEAAGPLFQEALEVALRSGDRVGEAYVRTGLGLVSERRGDLDGALRSYAATLELCRKTHDRTLSATLSSTLLSNMAGIHVNRGEFQEALQLYSEALSDGGSGDVRQADEALHNLATTYFRLGRTGEALASYERALASLPDNPATLNSIGTVLLRGDLTKAGDYFERALRISREQQNQRAEALSLHNRGRLRLAEGKTREALADFDAALALRRGRLHDIGGQASTLLEIGDAQSRLGKPEPAAAAYRSAEALAGTIGARLLLSRSLESQAKLDRDRGDLARGLGEIERALKLVEAVRSDAGDDDQRTSFFAANRYYYELYIDLLMRQWQTERRSETLERALEASELARARGLADLLAEGKIDVRSGVDPELKRQEIALSNQVAWAARRLRQTRQAEVPDEAAARQWENRLADLERDRQKLVVDIRARNPRYAEVHYPQPLPAAEIRRELDGKTALLEYAVGPETTYLFVVTREGITPYALPGAVALGRRVERLRAALQSPNPALRGGYVQEAAGLYHDLVAPALGSLADKRDLLLSPDGVLHLVPFEALLTETPGRDLPYSRFPFLLRQYSISYLPSASVLPGLHKPRSIVVAAQRRVSFLAFADPLYAPGELPPLPRSAEEVKAIADLFPGSSQLYLGPEANRDRVFGNRLLAEAPYVHFAVHGIANEERPQLSGLVLSRGHDRDDDGYLRVHDIFDLKLNADLVVLSACDTGRVQVHGEGLVGLTRAFFYAGASSLVVSLWRVDESAAPDLMARFYRQLKGGKVEALRAAKEQTIDEGRYAHPAYWAPFVLVGDPR